MIQNSLKTSLKLIKNVKNSKANFLKYYSTSESLKSAKLAYTTYEPSIPDLFQTPFLILHGLFGSKQNWSSLCKAYSQKIISGRKIMALDLRNHGESEHADIHNYDYLASDVKHFLEEQKIDKMALMGHSMGGRCAMLFALKYPELVEKLIIVDISPATTSPHIHEMPVILHTMERTQFPSNVSMSQARKIVDQQLAEVISTKELREFILTNLVKTDQTYKWRVNIPVLMKDFDQIARFPEINDKQYLGDTLFLGGGDSGFIPQFSKTLCTKTPIATKFVRYKADLAETEKYGSVVDLAYASYQGTESSYVDGKKLEEPTPLVLVHGILGSKSNFNTLSKRYHDSSTPKRLVYAVDLRNHGDSAHSKHNTYDDLAVDLSYFLHVMDLKKVSLLGHDIGGRVAMLFALKYPEIIEKLIVTDISPITTSHHFMVFPEILKTLNSMAIPGALSTHQAKLYAISLLSRMVKNRGLMLFILLNLVQKSDGSYTWRFNTKALLENFAELASFPNIHNITFPGPALFIGGGKSDYIQKTDYPKIKELFPKAELKYIDGAGHWVHSEKPHEFLKVTLDFLNKPLSES